MDELDSIKKILIEVSNEECPNYPNIREAGIFTKLWAIEQELVGRAFACDDLHKEIKKRDELLKAAKCPDCDGFGAYHDNDGEAVVCQWCDEVNKLKGKGDGRN